MLLIDKGLKDLAKGYARIRKADHRLRSKWRHQLLRAYSERRRAYEAARVAHRRRMVAFRRKAVIGLAMASALIVLGLLCRPLDRWIDIDGALACLGALLALVGLIGAGVLLIVWLWMAAVAGPRPLRHPLRGTLKAELFPPLLPRWREALSGRLPACMPYEGAKGEYPFVRRLQTLRGTDGYVLYRLQQNYGDDVDVSVVDPSGVWVFEVKYWSGAVAWRNGQWEHEKAYYESGGVLVTKNKEIGQPPDRQWQRMAMDVAKTLRYHASGLVRRLPALRNIKGGLVFTHPDARYEIARDCPFRWDTIPGWAREVARAPMATGMNEQVALQVVDTLLERHQEVSGEQGARSMDVYARRLIREVEADIMAWIRDGR